jgi:hypothetical protein
MKKIIVSTALIMLSGFAVAQDYTIKMTAKTEGLSPDLASFGEFEMVNYIKGDKYKNEITSMMVTGVTAFDGKKFTAISEKMGTKSGYTATKEELDEAAKADKDPKPKIEYTIEKKTIAGYECTKAIITNVGPDKKEEKMDVWFTEKIISNHAKGKKKGSGGMTLNFGDLKGQPLEISMKSSMNGMDLKTLITTTEVLTTTIDESAFNVDTQGYTMITFKEYQDKVKAMMEEK